MIFSTIYSKLSINKTIITVKFKVVKVFQKFGNFNFPRFHPPWFLPTLSTLDIYTTLKRHTERWKRVKSAEQRKPGKQVNLVNQR